MKYRSLGSSGLLVSRLSLGAMTFGADWEMPEEVWETLEAKTRPSEEYLTWFTRGNYQRFFAAMEFHEQRAELL